VGIVAVPLLRSQIAAGGFRFARKQSPRDPDGNGRSFRRQGRFSFHARGACGIAGDEERQAGEDGVRRMEDLAATTKRHPSRIRIGPLLTKMGSCSPWTLIWHGWRRLLDAFVDRALARNPPFARSLCVPECAYPLACMGNEHGSLWGVSRFGAPQGIFAIECHMDEIAVALNMDPVELRRRNFLHDGDTPQRNR